MGKVLTTDEQGDVRARARDSGAEERRSTDGRRANPVLDQLGIRPRSRGLPDLRQAAATCPACLVHGHRRRPVSQRSRSAARRCCLELRRPGPRTAPVGGDAAEPAQAARTRRRALQGQGGSAMTDEHLRPRARPTRCSSASPGSAESAGVAKVEESIRIILGTQYGERVMRPAVRLQPQAASAFAPNNVVDRQPGPLLRDRGAGPWEPRIDVLDVTVDQRQRGAARCCIDDPRTSCGPRRTCTTSSTRSTWSAVMTFQSRRGRIVPPEPRRPDLAGPRRPRCARSSPSTRRSGPTTTRATSASP